MKKTLRLALLALALFVLLFTSCNYDDEGVFEYVLSSEPRDDRALNIIGSDGNTTSHTIYFKSKYGLESFNGGTYTTLDGSNTAKKATLYALIGSEYIVYLTQDTNNGTLQTPINGVFIYSLSSESTTEATSISYGTDSEFNGNPRFIIGNYIYCVSGEDTVTPYEIVVNSTTSVTFNPKTAITVTGYLFNDVDDNVLTFSRKSDKYKKYIALDTANGVKNDSLLAVDGNDLPCDDDVTVIASFVNGSDQYVVLQNDDYVEIYLSSDGAIFNRIHRKERTASTHLFSYFDNTYIYYNIPGYASVYMVDTTDTDDYSTESEDYARMRNIDIAGYFLEGSYLIIATRDNGFYRLATDISSFERY